MEKLQLVNKRKPRLPRKPRTPIAERKAIRQKNWQRRNKLKLEKNYTLATIAKTESVFSVYYLYGLKLKQDNYYVGLTRHKGALVRFQQHLNGDGSKWTRLHKPLEMLEVREIGRMTEKDALILEDQMTLEYIKRYSIAQVRGGSLCIVNGPSHMELYYKRSSVITVIRS